jgi:membrane protease YdiL (CAAX protease family)
VSRYAIQQQYFPDGQAHEHQGEVHCRFGMGMPDLFSPQQYELRDAAEVANFWFVAITAGICEEILYRGFLFSFLRAWSGIVAALVISSIVFGWAHLYQGYRLLPRTALVGLFLAVVVVLAKSLWPAILIHAAIDCSSGELGFAIPRAAGGESAGRPAADLLPDKPA